MNSEHWIFWSLKENLKSQSLCGWSAAWLEWCREGQEEPRSAVGIPAELVSDIGEAQRGADCSQKAVGRACRKAAGIEAVDTEVMAGCSRRAECLHKRHGETSPQTSAQR